MPGSVFLSLLLLCPVLSTDGFTETVVYLKNGKTMTGAILADNGTELSMEVNGGVVTLQKYLIERVTDEKVDEGNFVPGDLDSYFEAGMGIPDDAETVFTAYQQAAKARSRAVKEVDRRRELLELWKQSDFRMALVEQELVEMEFQQPEDSIGLVDEYNKEYGAPGAPGVSPEKSELRDRILELENAADETLAELSSLNQHVAFYAMKFDAFVGRESKYRAGKGFLGSGRSPRSFQAWIGRRRAEMARDFRVYRVPVERDRDGRYKVEALINGEIRATMIFYGSEGGFGRGAGTCTQISSRVAMQVDPGIERLVEIQESRRWASPSLKITLESVQIGDLLVRKVNACVTNYVTGVADGELRRNFFAPFLSSDIVAGRLNILDTRE